MSRQIGVPSSTIRAVTGEMRGGERNRGRQCFPYVRAPFAIGRPNIRSRLILSNPALRADFHGSDHLLPIMDPAKETQETSLPCLRAQGQPVNARFAQCLRKGRRERSSRNSPLPLGEGQGVRAVGGSATNPQCSGVAFAGDLGTLFNGKCFKRAHAGCELSGTRLEARACRRPGRPYPLSDVPFRAPRRAISRITAST